MLVGTALYGKAGELLVGLCEAVCNFQNGGCVLDKIRQPCGS